MQEDISRDILRDGQQTKRRNHKSLFIFLLILIVLIGVGAGSWWYINDRNSSPIPVQIRNSINFTIYYPATLPQGYDLDKSSTRETKGVLLYSFKKAADLSSIAVIEQSEPKGFDPATMFSNHPVPSSLMTFGTVYDLSNNQQSRFMVIADGRVLIFVSSPKKLDNSITSLVVNNLRPEK